MFLSAATKAVGEYRISDFVSKASLTLPSSGSTQLLTSWLLSRMSSKTTRRVALPTNQQGRPLPELSGGQNITPARRCMRMLKPRLSGRFQSNTDLFSIQYRCEHHHTATGINDTMGRTPGYDSSDDSFSCVLKCHGGNGHYRHVCMIL
jgi:hypothetical protein